MFCVHMKIPERWGDGMLTNTSLARPSKGIFEQVIRRNLARERCSIYWIPGPIVVEIVAFLIKRPFDEDGFARFTSSVLLRSSQPTAA